MSFPWKRLNKCSGLPDESLLLRLPAPAAAATARVVEVSPDKARKLSSSKEPDASNTSERIPPSESVRLTDLDEESSPVAAPPGAAEPSAPEPTSASVESETPREASPPETDGETSAASQRVPASDVPGDTQHDDEPVPSLRPASSNPPEALPHEDIAAASPSKPRSSGSTPRPPLTPLPAVDPLDAMPQLRPLRQTAGDHQRTGHPVRDRLLAKAAESSRARETVQSVPTASEFSALRGMEAELDQLAGPRQKLVSEPVRVGKAVLSPTTMLLGVTVIGLALIASLFLLLVKLAPKEHTPVSQIALAPTPTAAAVAFSASPQPLPSAVLPPPVAPPERKREAGPWRIDSAKDGQRLIRGTVGSNPFLKAIEAAGLERSQAYRVYAALKSHKDLDRCRPKDEFVALVDRTDKRVVAFEYIVSKEEIYQAREQDGKLVGKQLDLKVNKHRVQGSILVTTEGFSAAVKNAGMEASIGDVVNRALAGHTSVSQFRPGDRLRVVAQEVTVLGEFHRYAGIEALEYIPVDGPPVRIYYHAAKKQYYDAKGRAPGEGGWRNPVRGAPITSKFNPNRIHPILKKKMPHTGTDFGAPTGTPIYAASYGKITKLGNYGANGNYIAIEHDNAYETGYSHLSRFEPNLKVGDTVKRGQVIGYVGSTGRSTGPHLHFSARKNGAYIDPESLNLDALTVLPPAERAIFQGIKQKYDALLEAVALPPALPPQVLVTAAPPAAEADMHDDEGPDPDVSMGAAPAAVVPQQPQAAVPQPAPAPAAPVAPQQTPQVVPVAPAPGGAFFLSDKDLLQGQPLVDDGEVEE